ncbi:Rieske (2Fe-2S) protein [Caulobacter rhizosphaerae]|uniref:Rieske (2Fe-2S) protein n=1 Tax=Caulobacter rhizosphaerae TaxID=2010972 RepID=UPI0013D508AF|nr:Rieske (2Fe-2S) protein [Caulobacter rhizosphaerae]GGL17797.1 (2Fe-2S) ferredoxin [Caulobacter rhizosphaerae]
MSRTGPSNPARPAAGAILCALDEIASPGARGFRFRREDAVFAGFVVRRGDTVVGYVDSCPHAGWPLAGPNGRFLTRENDLILCAGHAALFRIEDGAMVAGPCQDVALTPWPVRIQGSDIVVA